MPTTVHWLSPSHAASTWSPCLVKVGAVHSTGSWGRCMCIWIAYGPHRDLKNRQWAGRPHFWAPALPPTWEKVRLYRTAYLHTNGVFLTRNAPGHLRVADLLRRHRVPISIIHRTPWHSREQSFDGSRGLGQVHPRARFFIPQSPSRLDNIPPWRPWTVFCTCAGICCSCDEPCQGFGRRHRHIIIP